MEQQLPMFPSSLRTQMIVYEREKERKSECVWGGAEVGGGLPRCMEPQHFWERNLDIQYEMTEIYTL